MTVILSADDAWTGRRPSWAPAVGGNRNLGATHCRGSTSRWGGSDIAVIDGAETAQLSELLLRVAAADKSAFAQLYDATSGRIYGLILRVLRDRGYSEEVAQETYLQIWRSADTYRPELGSPLAWMMTLAHRRAIDRVRAEQSGTEREQRYSARAHEVPFDAVADNVLSHAEAQEVLRCFSALTGKQFESVRLAYYQGLSSRQVAEVLGVPVPTAKTRIRDGLRALSRCLGVLRP